jgi:hypothetical protein
MKPLNTLPIEDFLNKARVAQKSNQRNISLDIKEVTALAESLSIVMTRLTGELDKIISSPQESTSNQIKMDGGSF